MSDLLLPEGSLVFNWETPRRRNLVLIGFLALSFALHAAGLYLFQIVYPPAASLPPQPARLTLITPNSEEGRTILRWVEAEDPAIVSGTMRPVDIKATSLPVIQHIPSYSIAEPELKHPPPLNLDLRIPSSQPAGPVVLPRSPSSAKKASLPTTVLFSPEIQLLGNPVCAAPKFIASTTDAPQALLFRIAVGHDGEIRFCFAENSSGDGELDEQARRYLSLCRFPQRPPVTEAIGANEIPSVGDDLTWGTATVEWGNDLQLLRPETGSAQTMPGNSTGTSRP